MLATLALSLVLVQQGPPNTDTTVTVQSGARLVMSLASGDVRLRTWDRSQVRVEARHSSRTTVEVRSEGAVVRVEVRGRMGMPAATDLDLTIPSAMVAELDGMSLNVDAEGMRGALKVGTLQGDVTVRNGGELDLSVLNGDLNVSGSRGRARLSTASGEIRATGIEGDLSAEAISGSVWLHQITSRRVDVEAVSGRVVYQGSVEDGGSYMLASHSGSVTFGMPAAANAAVTASTYSGSFSASFSLPAVDERSRSRRTVRLGTGSATVDLESFSGSIRLVRPNEIPAAPEPRQPRDRDRTEWQDGLELSLDLLGHMDLTGLTGLAALGDIGARLGEMSLRFDGLWKHELDLDLVPDIRLEMAPRRDRSAPRPPHLPQER